MASIITATVSSGLTQSADTSGVLQLASGTGNLVTIPSVTGTAMVSGNMPAFQAYLSSNQTINNNTLTTVAWNTTSFDTANCFNTSTYRFTPTVAGYYLFIVNLVWASAPNTGELYGYLNKNTTGYAIIDTTANGSTFYTQNQSIILYANGTTDYFTFSIAQSSGSSKAINGSATSAIFTGSLLRAA